MCPSPPTEMDYHQDGPFDDDDDGQDSILSSPSLPPPPLSSANNNHTSSINSLATNKFLGNFPDVNFNDGPGGTNAGGGGGGGETKVIYHIDDEMTPYLVKIPMPSVSVTLRDFKIVLNKQNSNYKYFFKSMDADFG